LGVLLVKGGAKPAALVMILSLGVVRRRLPGWGDQRYSVFFTGTDMSASRDFRGKGLKLLVIDQSSEDRTVFGYAVEQAARGISLAFAGDAEEGILYFEGRGKYADRAKYPMPDLVVLALRLVGMTAAEFLQWRLGSPEASRIPVVLFTGVVNQGEIDRALGLGASDYVPKPLGGLAEWVAVVNRIWEFGVAHPGGSPGRNLNGRVEDGPVGEAGASPE